MKIVGLGNSDPGAFFMLCYNLCELIKGRKKTMGAKLTRLSKLITAQLIVSCLNLIVPTAVAVLLPNVYLAKRIADITFVLTALAVNTIVSFTIHSMQKDDGNFKLISVMCFFAGVAYSLKSVTTPFGIVSIPGAVALAFMAVYIFGFCAVLIKKLVTADPLLAQKWVKFRMIFIVTASVLAVSMVLTKIPKIDMFAFIFFILAIVTMYVLAIRFALLIKSSAGVIK